MLIIEANNDGDHVPNWGQAWVEAWDAWVEAWNTPHLLTRAMVNERIAEWNNVEEKSDNKMIDHFRSLMNARPVLNEIGGGRGWQERKEVIMKTKMHNLLTWYVGIMADSIN